MYFLLCDCKIKVHDKTSLFFFGVGSCTNYKKALDFLFRVKINGRFIGI